MNKPANSQSKTAFDPTKPVQTRDGRKARIICTDRKHRDGAIIALISYPEGEFPITYYDDGKYRQCPMPLDLVNIPKVTTKISNVYRHPMKGTKGLWSDYPGVEKKDMPYSEYIGYLEWKFEDGEPVSAKFVKDSQ